MWDTLYLGKTYSSCYFYEDYTNETLKEKLNKFFENHSFCMEELKNNDYEPKLDETKDRYSYDNQFEICYEYYRESDE